MRSIINHSALGGLPLERDEPESNVSFAIGNPPATEPAPATILDGTLALEPNGYSTFGDRYRRQYQQTLNYLDAQL
jgi:hypothetical protein